jgi:FKBP-type peptidyl-prolyl cis-trans isomerase FkpA
MRSVLIVLSMALVSCSSKPEPSPESTEKNLVSLNNDQKAYLEKAAAEPGAQKTASGLVYRDITAGSGASPKATDTVKVHYRGTLINGKEFDSSYARNEPAEFPLNRVIPCWTEGVQKMKVGGKARLVCPSSIAYGEGGAPPDIPGGATLVFEIELLGIS